MKSVLFRPNRALQCVCCMFKFSIVFALANSVDPDEILRYVAFHLGFVIPVAITAVYLSKQGVSDLGYTQAHVSFHL